MSEGIKKIGPYEIIREIGRGGMGVVYLAKHPTLVDVEVALKAMFPDPSRGKDDPVMMESRKRFRNEAEMTAKLNHPSIITVYDYGNDAETGILYLAMDNLDGGTLKEILAEKGKFTLEETLEIVKPIAKALEFIHERGIIHRDLKPSNIMFYQGHPVITDFGIAMDVQRTVMTETGRLVGSIPYMSPERIDEEEFDHRADIYALGVIIYEMLTGSNPFAASSPTGIMKKVSSHEPPLLSKIIPEIPDDFAILISMLMEKGPENRPDSLNSFIK
ncbi:MAG: serine/threonine-protein kinase, partial [bacterium]